MPLLQGGIGGGLGASGPSQWGDQNGAANADDDDYFKNVSEIFILGDS